MRRTYKQQLKAVEKVVRRLKKTGKIEPSSYEINGIPVKFVTLKELREKERILKKHAKKNKNKKIRLIN